MIHSYRSNFTLGIWSAAHGFGPTTISLGTIFHKPRGGWLQLANGVLKCPDPQDTFKSQFSLRFPIKIHGSGARPPATRHFQNLIFLAHSNQNTWFWGLPPTNKIASKRNFLYAFQSKYMVLWPASHQQYSFNTQFSLRLPIKIHGSRARTPATGHLQNSIFFTSSNQNT